MHDFKPGQKVRINWTANRRLGKDYVWESYESKIVYSNGNIITLSDNDDEWYGGVVFFKDGALLQGIIVEVLEPITEEPEMDLSTLVIDCVPVVDEQLPVTAKAAPFWTISAGKSGKRYNNFDEACLHAEQVAKMNKTTVYVCVPVEKFEHVSAPIQRTSLI